MLDVEQALTENEAGYGAKCSGWFAKLDLKTYSWRIPQCSLLEGLDVFSLTWPRWGTMLNGVCSELTMPAHLTAESESGFWPTPTVSEAIRGHGYQNSRGTKYPTLTGAVGAAPNQWPTPNASDNRPRATAQSTKRRRELGKQISLEAAVKFPTPTGTQHKGWSPGHNRANTDDRLDYTIERQGGDRWWDAEPGLGRMVDGVALGVDFHGAHSGINVARVARGIPNRVNRLKCIGNGQVPATAVMAYLFLSQP